MPDHDLEKLLGGFAADTLTPEEQRELYHAALHDQQLFAALADEQALKELLTDPVVREKLLRTLQRAHSASLSTTSWLDWARRPTGLAWAGGLAAAVFAVILGTRIYQDSVKEAGRSVATEETKPAAPPASSPSVTEPAVPRINDHRLTTQDNEKSAASPRKDALTGKTAKRETTAMAKLDEQRARDSSSPLRQREEDALQGPPESIPSKLARSEEASALVDQQSASSPSAPPPVSAPTTIPALPVAPGQASSTLSARSLFWGAGPQGRDKSIALDTQRRERTAGESSRPSNQSAFTTQPSAMAKGRQAAPHQPVGIRYSLTAKEPSDPFQDRGTETATPEVPKELTIESNQTGFLQVWKHDGASTPQLLFPISETEQPRSKLTAYTPLTISLPSPPTILVIRFSRSDTVHSATFDRTLLDYPTRRHLQESVMTDEPSRLQPPIHYIVNQDPSLSEIVVQISPPRP